MYDYPIDVSWTTQEIIDVMALYNAVEDAYERGISKAEFLDAYNKFIEIIDSKSMQKQIDKAFKEVSGYSIYETFKASQNNDWIELK